MTLSSGARLGPYEILSPLGAGGMGEVYRARDLRLGRDVAIKVLPPEFVADADRRARFQREAKAAGRGAVCVRETLDSLLVERGSSGPDGQGWGLAAAFAAASATQPPPSALYRFTTARSWLRWVSAMRISAG